MRFDAATESTGAVRRDDVADPRPAADECSAVSRARRAQHDFQRRECLRRRQWGDHAVSGFCATVFADNIGHARHMVVAPNGVVYVNTWSGRYYANTDNAKRRRRLPGGAAGHDRQRPCRQVVRFGPGVESGNAGGDRDRALSWRAIRGDQRSHRALRLGAGSDHADAARPRSSFRDCRLPATIPCIRSRSMRRAGCMSTSARPPMPASRQNRMPNSPGIQPCMELETRAGIWRYDANRTGQQFSSAERFATGLRNGEGIAFDFRGRIFATQHGRINSGELDRASTRRSRAPTSRRRNSRPARTAAPTTAGRIAISI